MLASGFFLKAYNSEEADCNVKNDEQNSTPVTYFNTSTNNKSASSSPFRCGFNSFSAPDMSKENAGKGISDFVITVSEAYRQECKSENRGGDSDSFVHNSNHMDNFRQRSKKRDNKNEMKFHPDAVDDLSTSRGSNSMIDRKLTDISPNSTKFLDHITSPPCVDRMLDTNDNFQPSTYLPKGVDDTKCSDVANTEGDKKRHVWIDLIDLNRQDFSIQNLIGEIERTQNVLDERTQELNELRDIHKREQFKHNNIQKRVTQRQKKLQDLFEKQAKENKKLQIEISTLKISTSKRDIDERHGTLLSCDNSTSTHNAHNMYFKAEIVELRSNLAEARASKIDDLSKVESQVEESRQKIRELLQVKEISMKNEIESKNKLESLHITFRQTQSRYEENMKIAIKSADDVRANLERLERERCKDKLNSSADIERVNSELNKSREEYAKLEQELSRVQILKKIEKEQWDKDLDCLRQQKSICVEIECNLRDEIARYKTEVAIKLKRIAELNNDVKLSKDFECMKATERQLTKKNELQKSLIHNLNEGKLLNSSSQWVKSLPQINVDTSPVGIQANSVYEEKSVKHEALYTHNQSRGKEQSHPMMGQSNPKDNDTIKHSMCFKNASTPSSRNTVIFSSSRSSRKSSLNELTIQLEASKKRLKEADQRLNGLVNNKGILLNVVRSPNDSGYNVSVEDDGNIEVNHRHLVDI